MRLVVNHLPLRRELQGITNVVANTVKADRFNARNMIMGTRSGNLVRIRDPIPDELWNGIDQAVIGTWNLNSSQQAVFAEVSNVGLEDGLCLVQGRPGTGKSYLIAARRSTGGV